MVLLQAAMLGEFILVVFYGIFLIIGTILLTGLFMKSYWTLNGKGQNLIQGKPYYKEPLPFFISIILSIAITTGVFYFILVLFDKAFPNLYFD
jgi:hypothetical protein